MTLIESLKKLPELQKTYLEILEVHDKEVPIANLLAFFFRNKEVHGLGDLFIKSLLKTKIYELDIKKYPYSTDTLISQGNTEKEQQLMFNSISNVKVETEVKTSKDKDNNKRIDILIDTDKFVICIEFKINHKLNNPLETYKHHIAKTYKDSDKQIFYIVLTPSKKVAYVSNTESYLEKNKIFKQMIIGHFIKNIQNELPSNFKESESFKYYNDFIQTIQNREIRYKRSLLLERINSFLIKNRIKSKYHNENKGGFIQIDKINYSLKIRIKNKEFQFETWIKKKEKIIKRHLNLDTSLEEILRNVNNL
ncbi:PD-(D/E)XK nuclease family protein [Wenyingzhuangia aestuarii]|uniref:PD-(D/E)XK nuclease family protein n=1 Tax=Wenyingzhuangia aestuarii TaxID=1647582 RepID=UPI00143932C8|nr:PD-(D/E)XK nuclease family protein [Wenyingzhuangia aestuarii]NJB84197.1 hypothetical protein [Wenyingzhuangia aestuarii]